MAEGDVELGPVLDTDHTVQLLLNFDEEVMDRSKHHSRSIYMVPSVIRDLNPSSYTPQVVSIGPLHHQDEHLKGFEVQKATYMHNLFNNVLRHTCSTPEQIMKACVTKVSSKIEQIKACYIGMQPYTDSELVKMMVTDACFILAYIYNFWVQDSSLGENRSLELRISRDMILIENQIPFFVLQDIHECTFLIFQPRVHLVNFISTIHSTCTIFERPLAMDNSSICPTYDHILGFLHKSYQNPDLDSSSSYGNRDVKTRSAVELHRSGVTFSNELDAQWPMAIELEFSSFLCFPSSWSKPTLKLPVLRLFNISESVLRNLIVYEQSSAEVQTCVTSYLQLMDMLIDIPEDVAMLTKSQVLNHYFGSDEKAADLINGMLNEAVIRDYFYDDQLKKLEEYYNAYWPNLIAELRRKYFSNPWSIIALIAGFALFVLTVVQTIYGVKAV